MKKVEVYNKIPVGIDRAVTLEYLVAETGLNGRTVRLMIEHLITNEMPVCNIGTGYFRPKTIQELDAYCKFINSYRCKLLKKLYRLERSKRHFGLSHLADKGNVPKKDKKAL